MKKRILCLLLSLALLLAACGGSPQESESGSSSRDAAPSPAAASSDDSSHGDGTKESPDEPTSPSALLPGLLDSYDPADEEQNNVSYLSAGGRIIHAYGGTWFVQKALDNDGTSNGEFGSENIYFLSDQEGAEPALVAALPAGFEDNIQQMTVLWLVPGPQTADGRFLYYIGSYPPAEFPESLTRYILCRVDLETKETEVVRESVFPGWDSYLMNRSGDRFYFHAYPQAEEETDAIDGSRSGYLKLDLATGEITPASLDLPASSTEMNVPVGLAGEYLYYAKAAVRDGSLQPVGFFRVRMGTSKEEEIAPLLSEYLSYVRVLGGYLVYTDEEADEYVFISCESGQEALRLPEDGYDLMDRTFALEGDELFYFEEGNLKSLSISSGETKTLIESRDRDAIAMSSIGEWIWFMDEDDHAIYRVAKTGRILPGSPVVALPDEMTFGETEPLSDGTWLYREYPKGIEIVGYTGSEETVAVPAKLHGKAVIVVWLDLREHDSVKRLVLSEGVISVRSISGSENLIEIQLPKSLRHMMIRGYDWSFHVDPDTVIRYAGTVAEWEALAAFNRRYHDVSVDSSRNEVDDVICSDGIWHRTEEY